MTEEQLRAPTSVREPDLLIVDPHHHLWDRPGSTYLLPQLLEDMPSPHRVHQTVFIQCRAMYRAGADETEAPLGETEFVNGIAAMSASGQYGALRACAGIVGFADLKLGDAVKPVLEKHCGVAKDRFRGVRQVTAWDPDSAWVIPGYDWAPKLLETSSFREGVACLGRMGLSFDALVYFHQLPELRDLARACPDTPIVVNHVGLPLGSGSYSGRRTEVLEVWRNALADLATAPNVFMKIGGFGTPFFGPDVRLPGSPQAAELAQAWRPYVETVVEHFGAERCMFESNFPVDKGLCSYATLWDSFKIITEGWSSDEKSALYSRSAQTFYRLPA